MSAFTFAPDYGASKSVKPLVKQIKFGDGYQQRSSFGLNTLPQVWTLRFSGRPTDEANQIDNFLANAGGVASFDWTPPDSNTPLRFICSDWSRVADHPGSFTISATFTEVFEP